MINIIRAAIITTDTAMVTAVSPVTVSPGTISNAGSDTTEVKLTAFEPNMSSAIF